jgi:hypothetical protein
MLKLFKILVILFLCQTAQASYDQDITIFYQWHPAANYHKITERIADYSSFFLAKPYQLYPIGEGETGKFDQNPLYRTDVFDCFSYVTFILVLAESNNLAEFQRNYVKINYANAIVSFEKRFHFTNDWNIANANNKYLIDITKRILDKNGKPVYKVSTTVINIPGWYQKLPPQRIRLIKPKSPAQLNLLLTELHSLSNQVKPETSIISYIPLKALFIENGQPNNYLFDQIPSGSIIEIVRSNWDLTKTVGTNLDVSHLGFAIRTPKGLVFRAASSSDKWGTGVIDIPLIAYLQNCLKVKSISGINIQVVSQFEKI